MVKIKPDTHTQFEDWYCHLATVTLIQRHITMLPYKVPTKNRIAAMFELCRLYSQYMELLPHPLCGLNELLQSVGTDGWCAGFCKGGYVRRGIANQLMSASLLMQYNMSIILTLLYITSYIVWRNKVLGTKIALLNTFFCFIGHTKFLIFIIISLKKGNPSIPCIQVWLVAII